jgi:hypothetical protein
VAPKNVVIENAVIAFRNFAGREDKYNKEGDRNFAILLEQDRAEEMLVAGWNVKFLNAREEGDIPQAYIQVSVSFKNKPPKVAMITSKNITYLLQDDVGMLDWVDIEIADVELNAYEWVVGAKSGVKAYAKSVWIKILEDYLQDKWTAWIDEQPRVKALTSGYDDYLEAEVVPEPLAVEG